MIRFKTGDILAEDAEAIVNTVNCVGVMGRGIALQFKKAFPDNFKTYAAACDRKEVLPGRMFVFETGRLANPRYIINFPTKRHWRGKSRIEDIKLGLEALAQEIRTRKIHSIAVPPLGSGLGGLDWSQVRPMIEEALSDFHDLNIVVYEPGGAPNADKMVSNREVPKMTPPRAALIALIHRYLGGLLDPFVTLLEIHKLMYFMQEAGEPLKLRYQQAPYGPYAENLRHLLNHIEGHLISGYADGGDAPDKQLELVPGAIEDAKRVLSDNEETRARFDKVTNLVEGFETPFGLELLATAHWVVTKERVQVFDDVVARIYAWSENKKQFSRRQIGLAINVLSREGWISEIGESAE